MLRYRKSPLERKVLEKGFTHFVVLSAAMVAPSLNATLQDVHGAGQNVNGIRRWIQKGSA